MHNFVILLKTTREDPVKIQIFKLSRFNKYVCIIVPASFYSIPGPCLFCNCLSFAAVAEEGRKKTDLLNLLHYISCTIRFFEDDCLVDSSSRSVGIWLEGFILCAQRIGP